VPGCANLSVELADFGQSCSIFSDPPSLQITVALGTQTQYVRRRWWATNMFCQVRTGFCGGAPSGHAHSHGLGNFRRGVFAGRLEFPLPSPPPFPPQNPEQTDRLGFTGRQHSAVLGGLGA
jgi:hypothetical protein